jgi:hypothetical protein
MATDNQLQAVEEEIQQIIKLRSHIVYTPARRLSSCDKKIISVLGYDTSFQMITGYEHVNIYLQRFFR